MNTLLRSLLAAGFAALTLIDAQARIDRVIEKSFPVTGPGVLRVETQGGAIRVMPSTDSAVRVMARQRVNASTDKEADELLKKLELDFRTGRK